MRCAANGEGLSAVACYEASGIIAGGTELEKDGPGDVAIYIWYDGCILEGLQPDRVVSQGDNNLLNKRQERSTFRS